MTDPSSPIAKLEYRVWRPADEQRHGDPILQFNSNVTMADYHFRVKAERLGIDPLTITTTMHWGDGECRFVIEAPAAEESLSLAFSNAVQLVGLQAERM